MRFGPAVGATTFSTIFSTTTGRSTTTSFSTILLDDDRLLLLDHNGLTGGPGRTLGAGGAGSTALTLRASGTGRPRRTLDVANLDFATGSGEHTAQRYGCATEIASADHTRHG